MADLNSCCSALGEAERRLG